jgi:hypothetical protein
MFADFSVSYRKSSTRAANKQRNADATNEILLSVEYRGLTTNGQKGVRCREKSHMKCRHLNTQIPS